MMIQHEATPNKGATTSAATSAVTAATMMKAVQASDYGDIDQVLQVQDQVLIPRLADLPPSKQKNFILIKTLAVALAPGDCRVLSGLTRELQGPPSFPYIPGGDCCGIVVEMPQPVDEKEELPFKVGDRVAARFVEAPRGALGEYALVHKAVCDKVPDNVSNEGAAALASATPALAVADCIRPGERVLILGAGGGVGSHVCQIARVQGASLVVGVSQTPERLLKEPLCCDKAVNYTKDDVFGLQEYKDNPFDTIIDLASGGWPRLLQDEAQGVPSIVKPASLGGRYLTTTPDSPIYEVHSILTALNIFLFPALWRALKSRSWSRTKLPAYSYIMGLPQQRQIITRTLELAQSGKLKPVIHGDRPFPFTTEGVRRAFRVQESRHAHGKVVITLYRSLKVIL